MGGLYTSLSTPMPSDMRSFVLPNYTLHCTKKNCQDDRETNGQETYQTEEEKEEQDLQETLEERRTRL